MFKQLFATMSGNPVMTLPLVSLAIFLLVFVVVTLRVMLDRSKELDRMAAMPLDEAEGNHHE